MKSLQGDPLLPLRPQCCNINSPMYKQVVHLHVNRSSNHVSAITYVELEPVEHGLVGDLDDLEHYVLIKDVQRNLVWIHSHTKAVKI